jgi:hypothetical protein
MELNTSTLSDFVKLADVLFVKGYNSVPQSMRGSGLVKETPIDANSGNTREFSEIDLEEYASKKGQSDQASRASVQQGYSKTMTQYRIAKDIGISYEMRTQNKYIEVTSRLTGLGRLAVNRLDLDLAMRISYAASTSYTDMDGETVATTTGDGYQLAYSAHTLKGSSTQYRNILANNPRVSKGALEAIERLQTEEVYNQFGETMSIPFDIIWSTNDPNTVNTISEYLKSTSSPDAGVSGVTNVYAGKYRHVILPRIDFSATTKAVDSTKRYYWGTASSVYSTFYLGIWEEAHLKTPSDLNAGEDFATDDWDFGVRAGYGMTIVNAAWIKFSKGDGSA